jgi:acyl-CoA dehydrogenase
MYHQAVHPNATELEAFVLHALTASNINTELHRAAINDPTAGSHFPGNSWQSLAAHDFLHRFIPSFSTADAATIHLPCQDIALTGYLMTRHHLSLGLTMTWIGQLLKCHFLRTLACHDPAYTEAILNGDSLCALAISEPKVGAHPKHLSCSAVKHADTYIINGEKAFVSHGPYADRFIVLAITEQTQSRKYFSAFLVPANNPGLRRMPAQPVKGLQPSSHCNIVFSDCHIPSSTLLGTAGQAFEEISLPMRTLEDSLMLAPIAGAMQAQLDYLARASSACNKPLERHKMGELLSLTESAKELGIIAASKLDEHEDIPDLSPLIIGFRSLVDQVQTTLLEWHDEYPGLRELASDIQILSNIGRQATAARTASLTDRFLAEQRE